MSDNPVLCSVTRPAVRELETLDALSIGQLVVDDIFARGAYLTCTDSEFLRFSGTHWIPLSEAELGGMVLQHLHLGTGRGQQRPRAVTREVIELLKMRQATGTDRSRLNEPPPVINVANGELWITPDGSVECRPHNAASGLRYCLDVAYDPKAVCPLYDRALREIFSDSMSSAALVDFWHEFAGYLLQPARPDARIFVGWGAGSDGKTALAGLLVRLLGCERVAAMPVGELASNRFMRGHLADKALFLDDDVAVGTILPDGLLKTISEAKVVTGEPKHREAFEFRVGALPLLLCNDVPHLRDTSHGFRRRLTVIPFERQFTSEEADRTLFPRIWETERSGVLNRALEGLQRVSQRGWKFDLPEAVNRASEAWWVEATDASSDIAPMAIRSTRGPGRTSKPGPPTSKPGKSLGEAHVTSPVGADQDAADLSINIKLPAAGKGYAVQVRVGAATVDVRVIAEPDQQTAPLVQPTPKR
ncbi:hypothetical protein MKK63_24420 [Methylobacterium sp. J-088]|uniref:DNA primase family protein n=1 Tax=Methylobacterium sp. J-088 TaxID=2836664 RepID=UPI001FBA738A|nr:DNA primase family protein [Methylobacterium sp. J-088]MCJ2065825.1 hypothetical protein [Methylobacterium sp. J-088]